MRKYRILELVITRDQTRNALHAPSRSLQESPQEGTAGTEPSLRSDRYKQSFGNFVYIIIYSTCIQTNKNHTTYGNTYWQYFY
jgi:hypothetical protein